MEEMNNFITPILEHEAVPRDSWATARYPFYISFGIKKRLYTHDNLSDYTNRRNPLPPHLRHDAQLTFGIELELILDGVVPKDGLNIMNTTLKQLFNSGKLPFDSMIPEEHKKIAPADRNKFMIMPDPSINARLGLKEGVQIPDLNPGWEFVPVEFVPDCGDWGTPELNHWHSKNTATDSDSWGDSQSSVPESYGTEETEITTPDSDPVVIEEVCSEEDDWFAQDTDWVELSPDLPPIKRKEKPLCQEEEKRKWMLAQPEDKCILGAAVEICTPILQQRNVKKTIRTVIEHLDKELKVVHNKSCGLHIHVGRGQGNRWSFEEMKAIAKACFLFEEAVNLKHAPHRREGNRMIRSNRWSTAARDATMLILFEEIDDCDSEWQFLHLVGKEKYFKYNFHTNAQYGTIEFRQAEGHKDSKRIIEWVKFLSYFVTAAINVDQKEWFAWGQLVGYGTIEGLLNLDSAVFKRFGLDKAQVGLGFKELELEIDDTDCV
ncbi:putative amidoligase enzyme-domain-containing protein [Pyronema domesticum]|uniref:Uncharacterized protein n=1 Tax=Pyronema omphalodes (strain CBS 100304) TaxID=1076935 RepID=U4KYT2_PYROM|nr:putative amidoligase enzyme-domain-containing protein [Pyronema domesticum]CCX07141.1 Similar to predicted protein [Chaetomium globosum CBS 148.51]; acc. no. XP_001221442 [Pyronema omphalodes CBS 100304]